MNKNRRNVIVTFCTALCLVGAGSLLLGHFVREDRAEESKKNIVIDERLSVSAGGEELFAQPEEKTQAEAVLKLPQETPAGWTMPEMKVTVEEEAAKPRPEDMEAGDAAEIGVKYLETMLEADCGGKELHLRLRVSPGGADSHVWQGVVEEEADTELQFLIDAVSGKLMRLMGPVKFQPAQGDSAAQAAYQVYQEEREAWLNDSWMSTGDFLELNKLQTWSKLVKKTVKENGLNGDKVINSVEIIDFDDNGRVSLNCWLNELKADKEKLQLTFDIRTKKLYQYFNNSLAE